MPRNTTLCIINNNSSQGSTSHTLSNLFKQLIHHNSVMVPQDFTRYQQEERINPWLVQHILNLHSIKEDILSEPALRWKLYNKCT